MPCPGSDEFNGGHSAGYKAGWNAALEAAYDRLMLIQDSMGPRFCGDQIRKMKK